MNTASASGSGTLPGNIVANPKGELKAITTRSGLVTEGPTVPNPPKSVNPEEDECIEETYTNPDLAEYTIKVPPPPVQKPKPPIQRNIYLHTRDSLPPHIPDPRVPLILGRPFLRTSRALIDVHGEEMILHDEDERLNLNMKHDTASYSNRPRRESVNLINIFNLSSEDFLEDLVSNKQSGNPTFSLHKEIASSKSDADTFDNDSFDFKGEKIKESELLIDQLD
nr:reverse transcriptase domain-containing protein [Tanacetum cinerariifolium]